MKLLHIFRAGRHRDRNGNVVEFSEADVQDAVDSYDPALQAAPLVVGHPTTNAPAYGWVDGLLRKDANLFARPKDVHPEFMEAVNSGAYRSISASFYLPDAPANPKPGHTYLRHIGFLGAQAPAIKGLQPAEFAEFAEDVEGVVEFADAQLTANILQRFIRGIREYLIEAAGLEKADQVVPSWWIEDADYAADADPIPSFSEPDTDSMSIAITTPTPSAKPEEKPVDRTAEFAEREEQLKTREQQLAEREAQLARQEVERRQRECTEFAETLAAEGRILPRHQATVVHVLSQLAASNAVVEFGEGDDAAEKPVSEALRDMLRELPQQVEYAEAAGAAKGKAEAQPADVHARAARLVEYQEEQKQKGRVISVAQAAEELKATV